MKRLTSLLLVITIMCTVLVFPASAVSSDQYDISQFKMEQYFTLTASGLIEFDTSAAINDSVNQEIIDYVQRNVTIMNSLVLAGEAYINGDFHAISYPKQIRSVTGGVTGYDYAWDGSLLIYLDSDTTNDVINDLVGGSDVATSLLDIFDNSGFFSGLYTVLNTITLLQLSVANQGNTGVVINVKPNFNTGGQDIYIWSQ